MQKKTSSHVGGLTFILKHSCSANPWAEFLTLRRWKIYRRQRSYRIVFFGICFFWRRFEAEDMGVSEIVVPPNHPFFSRVFHSKPSNLGYPYFWKHPYISSYFQRSYVTYFFPAKLDWVFETECIFCVGYKLWQTHVFFPLEFSTLHVYTGVSLEVIVTS